MLGAGLGFSLTARRSCMSCGMKFPVDTDGERMLHHLWRFHNERYHKLLGDMYDKHKVILKKKGLKDFEHLKEHCELSMIDYDIEMGCQQ